MRYVLPATVFLKLRDIGAAVLPAYREIFQEVPMTEAQAEAYRKLSSVLSADCVRHCACGDVTLLGVVLQVLLAWPDCCFRDELVRHPRTRGQLFAHQRAVFADDEITPRRRH